MAIRSEHHGPIAPIARHEMCGMRFDDLSLEAAAAMIVRRDRAAPFSYAVTPNVDHVVRTHTERELLPIYDAAWLCLCDSRILKLLGKFRAIALEVVPGSSLVSLLFDRFIAPEEAITIIGGAPEAIRTLRRKYALTQVAHYNPPMGFIADPSEVAICIDFVAMHPARYVFLAVGSPQQEILAARIAASGRAIGIGLCIGASLNFLTGIEKRAPAWMQGCSLEWLHRLLSDPRRLWRRYLVRGPGIVAIFIATWKRRQPDLSRAPLSQ